MVTGPTLELLDDDGGRWDGDGPGPRRGARWPEVLRRHRLPVAGAAVAGLVVAGVVAVRLMPADPMPTLLVPPLGATVDVAPPWQEGADGRPSSPVALTGAVMVQRPTAGAAGRGVEARVLGLSGPGIAHNDGPPTAVPVGPGTVRVPLRVVIDCTQVPEQVPDDAYALLVDAGRGSERRRGTVPVGQVTQPWAQAVRTDCATWTARRDVTVTGLTARVDPAMAAADLTLTIANTGARAAELAGSTQPLDALALSGPFPLKVPPRSTVHATARISLEGCNGVSQSLGVVRSVPTSSSEFGLIIRVGSTTPALLSADSVADQLPADLGLVVAGPARAALDAALGRMCGGDVAGSFAQTIRGQLAYRADTRQLELGLQLDLPPGRVRAVHLEPRPGVGDGLIGPLPQWQVRDLVPDAAGHVRTVLPYEAPPMPADCSQGSRVEEPTVLATVRVPDAGVDRVVHFVTQLGLGGDAGIGSALCLATG